MDILHGTALLWRTPRLWGLALAPLFVAVLLYIALGVGGGVIMIPLLKQWAAGAGPAWLATAGFVVVWILLFPFLFTLLAGAFAGVVFEPLSLAVEKIVRGERGDAVPHTPITGGAAFGDTLARLCLSVALAGTAFVTGFVFGIVPGILAASAVGLLDYTAPFYARRGKTLGAQWRDLSGAPDAPTALFAVCAGFLSLLPVIGVLMLPGMVAGGTLLALRRESGDGTRRG